jgi:FkbM family methyltransferase
MVRLMRLSVLKTAREMMKAVLPAETLRFAKNVVKAAIPGKVLGVGRTITNAVSLSFGMEPFADMATLSKGHHALTILDVGANKGQTALEFARWFPGASVHCLEPYPAVFEQLRRATQAFPNVKACNIAVGEKDGVAQLLLNKADVTNSLLKNAEGISQFSPAEWVEPIGSVNVSMTTLDQYCAKQNIERINVLKIDSQGYELNILKGASRLLKERRIHIIYLELLFVPLYQGQACFEDVYAHLKLHQYKLVGFYNRALHTDKSLKWCDGLFVASS